MGVSHYLHSFLTKSAMEELPETVRRALKHVIKRHGMSDFKIYISPATDKGDNYLGSVYRVEILGAKKGSPQVLRLICKVPPLNTSLKSNINVQVCFQREVYMYNVVLEQFKTFQAEQGVSPRDGFSSFVLCHAAESGKDVQYLIMEDLKAKSYEMLDKRSKLDRGHAELVVKGLAKFHAISFALRDQKPDTFKEYADMPDISMDVFGKTAYRGLCHLGLDQAVEALKDDADNRKRLESIRENCDEIMFNCVNGIGAENHRVVCHGDCWNNNIMFKYKNNSLQDLCFLDWQLARCTSPAVDLSFYFYNSAEKELLEEHFDDLMNAYHGQLSESIRLLGSDPERLYPYDAFRSDLKKFAIFGLIICTFGFNLILAAPETPPDFDEIVSIANRGESLEDYLGLKDEHSRCLYQSRIKCIVKHAADRNFI